jgi:hypothetical protein
LSKIQSWYCCFAGSLAARPTNRMKPFCREGLQTTSQDAPFAASSAVAVHASVVTSFAFASNCARASLALSVVGIFTTATSFVTTFGSWLRGLDMAPGRRAGPRQPRRGVIGTTTPGEKTEMKAKKL